MDENDSTWQYKAPQFVDFARLQGGDHEEDNVEDYFNFDHEAGGIPIEFGDSTDTSIYEDARANSVQNTPHSGVRVTPSMSQPSKTPEMDRRKTRSLSRSRPNSTRNTPAAGAPVDTTNANSGMKADPTGAGNICTSLFEWRKKGGQVKQNGVLQGNVVKKTQHLSAAAKRRSRSPKLNNPPKRLPRESDSPVLKKHKRSMSVNVGNKPQQSTSLRRSHSRAGLQRVEQMPAPRTQSTFIDRGQDKKTRQNTSLQRSHSRASLQKVEKVPLPRARSSSIDRGQDKKTLQNTSLQRSHSRASLQKVEKVPVPRGRSASMDRGRPANRQLQGSEDMSKDVADKKEATAGKLKLTMPVTPTFMKRNARFTHITQMKTTEQIEIEKIKELRKELDRKRKIAESSHKMTRSGMAVVPVHTKMPLTRTEEFHFATDDRLKNHGMETRQDSGQDTCGFAGSLRGRSASPAQQNTHKGPTIPQPFHLHDRKRKREMDKDAAADESYKYQSMAEKVIAFSRKTPDRFRSKVKKEPSPAKRRRNCGITVPKTPNLETRGRLRPVQVKSQAELEAEEAEEVKNYQFKAHPVNERIFKNHNLGVKKVEPKEPTRTEAFDLEAYRQDRADRSQDEEERRHYEFHAKPIPKGILEGPVGIKAQEKAALTVPESPAFVLKNRLRTQFKEPEPQVEEDRVLRARPIPNVGVPFHPKLKHQVTSLKPFSFETRDKHVMNKKEDRISKFLEDEKKAREFRARPIPDLSPDLPKVKTKSPTRLEPFQLEGEFRGAQRAEEWSHKMQEELREQKTLATFKAQPATVTVVPPFIPKKSTRPLTDVNDFELYTERRAEKRSEYDYWRKKQDMEAEAERLAREKEREEQEVEEIKKLRADIVHKAQPIRKYKPVDLHGSDKVLTDPHTPRFSDRLKTKVLRC